ncbi:DNA-binding MarR family transcriptional regulator [Novosphingobium capsulatum]|uniref:DNA-binding MarR family transcriptional regulator n=2 Tax=Novosphingobium capsulatum TaxID=13688 RepID=A0ABU1MIY0_9SPHN|nr:DNA-binding MarR family transcriptional regulator [Novosphingobium capsulatum]
MEQTPSDPLDTALSGPQAAAELAAQMAAGGPPLATGTADKPFANMLCFSVYAAQLAFNRLYKQLLAPHGLTYLQYLVLVALAQAEDRTVGELGEVLFLESNTLTPLLKRMEAAGLVVRRRDAEDERVVRVALAPAGAVVVAQVECVPLDVLSALDMPLDDLQQMKAAIDRLGSELRKSTA